MSITLSLRRNPDGREEDFALFPEAAHLSPARKETAAEGGWLERHEDGRLAVDVRETPGELIITSAVAAVRPEDIEVFLHNDMLTIRGTRHADVAPEPDAAYIVKECHWGSFSRSLILPMEVDADRITATIKDGVLVVRMPKTQRSKRVPVKGA